MTDNQHTPGPWCLDIGENGAAISVNVTVADIPLDAAGWKANARLIAAAPDLLAALQAVADYWAGGDVPADLDAAMRAAIAKATGA